jgi:hypothetical protein
MPIPLPTLDALESITIATPCAVPWGTMSGDDRSRFCDQCQRQVFDLSAMTRAEAVALLADLGRRPCVRLYRRPDGRVLTSDCPAGVRVRVWRGLRRRAAWAASLFAMVLLPACRTQGYVLSTPAETKARLPVAEEAREAEPGVAPHPPRSTAP